MDFFSGQFARSIKSKFIKWVLVLSILTVVFVTLITLVLIFQNREYQFLFILAASLITSAYFIAVLAMVTLILRPYKNIIDKYRLISAKKAAENVGTLLITDSVETYDGILSKIYIYDDGEKKTRLYVPTLCPDFVPEPSKKYSLSHCEGFLLEVQQDDPE